MDDWMRLIRPTQLQQLIINHEENAELKGTGKERDFIPVVRLFNPLGIGTWVSADGTRPCWVG